MFRKEISVAHIFLIWIHKRSGLPLLGVVFTWVLQHQFFVPLEARQLVNSVVMRRTVYHFTAKPTLVAFLFLSPLYLYRFAIFSKTFNCGRVFEFSTNPSSDTTHSGVSLFGWVSRRKTSRALLTLLSFTGLKLFCSLPFSQVIRSLSGLLRQRFLFRH